MAAQVTVGGVAVGLTTPLALAAVPVAVVVLWYLLFRRTEGTLAGDRSRRLLFASRLVVVSFLVVAAAGPYTVTARETPGDPRVTLLVDRSESMGVYDPDVAELVAAIEAEGVPVSTSVVGSGVDSRVGDGVIANLEADGSVLLVSDGQVTGGRSLDRAAELARNLNATVSALDLSTDVTERYVTVSGPDKTSAGVENTFLVRVGGVNLGPEAEISVSVDETTVATVPIAGPSAIEIPHTFTTPGTHRVVATVTGGDEYAVNDVFRKTVRVVDRPRVLYVSRTDRRFGDLLRNLYDVTTTRSVPADLDPYYAVVVQDVAAADVGGVDALQRYVIDGNGLVVVGGPNSYEAGDYASSPLAASLPVRVGESRGEGATVVLAIDVSGSTAEGMRVQKAVALDALDQLGDQNRVGLVAFNDVAYRVMNPVPLRSGRPELENAIRRLLSSGGTDIGAGLLGASDMLGGGGGNVILISDGLADPQRTFAAAQRLAETDTPVVTVGVGQTIDESLLEIVADVTDGQYLRADETSRLRLLFGDEERRFAGTGLTVVDPNHFITAGVETRSNPSQTNDVAVKEGADFLVAAGDGTPAVTAWQYGLGRVVSVTAYGEDGGLDGLLASPDSLLLSKSVNWAIGDPERKEAGVVAAPDTRVGEATTVSYVGPERPTAAGVSFRQVGPERFAATVVPSESGFGSVLDAEYAVNYPREYAGFGVSPSVRQAVATTGGQTFEPGQAAAIASFVRRQSTRVRDVRETWDWLFLVAALLGYLAEVGARRLTTVRQVSVP
ncbi:VWA domain-containing protein [Halobacteriaceae archaeon GCM10025711]